MNKKEQMIFSTVMGGLGMVASAFAHKPEVRYPAMIGTAAVTLIALGYEMSLPEPGEKKDEAKPAEAVPPVTPKPEEAPIEVKTDSSWEGAMAEPQEAEKEENGWKLVLTPQDNPFYTPI